MKIFDRGYSYVIDAEFDELPELTIDDCKNTLTQRNKQITEPSIPMNYGERAINGSAHTQS